MSIAKDFSEIHVLVTVQFSLSNTRFPPRSTSRTSALHSYCVTTVFAATVAFHRRECFVTGGSFCFFTVSLSFSLFVPVLGSGPVVYLQDFRVKAGLRRRLTHSFPYNHHGCMTHRPIGVHTRARASSPRSMPTRVRLVMSQANGLNILLSPRCMYS